MLNPPRRRTSFVVLLIALSLSVPSPLAPAAEFEEVADRAREFRGDHPVAPLPDGTIVAEAEEFKVAGDGDAEKGWSAKDWGENYYAATFAITFLSRKAFLGAPPQADASAASIEVVVPAAGRYHALVRYEAAYRFETQFTLRIEQNGQTKLERVYGARDNVKVWPFRTSGGGLQKEVAWYWGAVENTVWEGHDTFVDLAEGTATLTLIADEQPEPAAKRNVDLVMLTPDTAQVQERIEKEGYLPLDGWLTQAGDVHLRVRNDGSTPIKLTVPAGGEHSPYWVHLRNWQPVTIEAAPQQKTEWQEVGSLLDTLNDGAWALQAAADPADAPLRYSVEVGLRNAGGDIEIINSFESDEPTLRLAYDANTRYTKRIRRLDEVLYDLLEYVKSQPVEGQPPRRTIVYCYTFDKRQPQRAADGTVTKPLSEADQRYNAAREEFIRLMGVTVTTDPTLSPVEVPAGYVDLRNLSLEELSNLTEHLGAQAARPGGEVPPLDQIRTVSLGDEIGLERPEPDAHEAFREWARGQNLSPADINPAAGSDWSQVQYQFPGGAEREALAQSNPRQLYYSSLFAYDYGIEKLRQKTELIKAQLPNADTGANFSPHHGPAYLGSTYQWITLFRRGGMTMPWSEDYIWQLPVGTQQMNFILLDLGRAANRYHEGRDIHFYVMPHWPGNTPNSWRRLFYGCVGHGMTIGNLFEFRPVQAAYTENHASLPEMFVTVRRAIHEVASFEDIVQDGRVRWGNAGIWWSLAGDVWDNHRDPFGAGKRTLYIAARHRQLPLDIVNEEDALKGTLGGYKVLYLTDPNVSRAASEAIAAWVRGGGRLFATAGAGMFDEFNQPNTVMRELLGVEQTALEVDDFTIKFEKQDLPFAEAMDTVTWQGGENGGEMEVFGARSRVEARGAEVIGTFSDGSPAITSIDQGDGRAVYVAFLPGLTYFKPAIPLRPVDRGSTDDAMSHLIPTDFHEAAGALIGLPAEGVARPVECSDPLVEATIIDSEHGMAIPLTNWRGEPIQGLRVTVLGDVPATASLASGGKVEAVREGDKSVFTLDLDVADALILR